MSGTQFNMAMLRVEEWKSDGANRQAIVDMQRRYDAGESIEEISAKYAVKQVAVRRLITLRQADLPLQEPVAEATEPPVKAKDSKSGKRG